MKALSLAVALTAFAFLSSAYAADEGNQMGEWDEQQMQMHNQEMEQHLEQMQALMDEMHATNDPAQRRQLYEAHQKQMAEFMSVMQGSRDDMVMGMMGGGPKHGQQMPEGERQRHYMFEKRLDMMDNAMQMMMQTDQMMMGH